MKNELAAEVKRYKCRIKSNLLCETRLSKHFLADLSDTIDNYIEEKAVTRFADVEKHFGSPEQIAQSFFAETDITVIRKKIRLRQTVIWVLVVAFLIWATSITVSLIEGMQHNEHNWYGVEYIIDGTDPASETERLP